jgi:hypothetical protein
MSDSKSTTLLENEQADRFGPARSTGAVAWTREQADQVRTIQNEQSEQPTEEAVVEQAIAADVAEKFNA